MGLIYMATNTFNGKKYIGQTRCSLSKRKSQHHTKTSKGITAFGSAIAKYGKGNFTWEILHDGILLQEELDMLEQREIVKHNTVVPNGYNIREGGNGGYNGIRTGKTKEKMVAVYCVETGVKFQSIRDAARAARCQGRRVRLCCDYLSSTCKGLTFRYADTEADQRALLGFNNRNVFSVIEWIKIVNKSTTRKSKWNHAFHDDVRRRNEEVKVRKDKWKAEAEVIGRSEIGKRVMLERKVKWEKAWRANYKDPTGERAPKPICCVDTGIVYPSISAAAKAIGCDHRNIRRAAKDKQKTCAGLRWALVS